MVCALCKENVCVWVQRALCIFSAVLLMMSSTYAQASVQNGDQSNITEQPVDYLVGPGDLLSFHAFSLDELDQSIQVSNSGKIHILHVGVLSVAGMTVAQIENAVAAKFQEQGLVKDPRVSVRVTGYNSQPVFVVGEVSTPGQFMISGEMRLLDAISKAGGFTQAASEDGFLIRRRTVASSTIGADPKRGAEKKEMGLILRSISGNGAATMEISALSAGTKINFKEIKNGTRMDMNLKLQGADIIYVPRRLQQNIYIVGEVPFPGSYGLPQEYTHITAAQAVAYAGGPRKTSKKGFILRRNPDASIEEIAFDFSKVVKGKVPDIAVKPNDIIYVPRSIGKTIAFRMLDLVVFFSQQFLIF